MSPHDEESAPLEHAPGSTEMSETGSAELSPTPAAASPDEALLANLGQKFREIQAALEQKDWQALAGVLGLESVTVEGHPETLSSLVSQLEAATEGLTDFEAVLVRVSKHEVDENRARFSFRLRIMWSSTEDWEDHDLFVDCHLGCTNSPDGWVPAYLSMSRAQIPSDKPAKPAPAPAAPPQAAKAPVPPAAPPKPPAAQSAPKPSLMKAFRSAARPRPQVKPAAPPVPRPAPKPAEQPLTDDYFTMAAAQYFGQVPAPAPASEHKALPTSVGGKHHLLYVPVVMHEDLIKKILGGE